MSRYHFELPDTEVLAATAEAAAADAAAKEQTAKTTARAARQAERAAVRSLRASTDAEFALDAATALSAAGRTHREVTGTFRAVRKAEMVRLRLHRIQSADGVGGGLWLTVASRWLHDLAVRRAGKGDLK